MTEEEWDNFHQERSIYFNNKEVVAVNSNPKEPNIEAELAQKMVTKRKKVDMTYLGGIYPALEGLCKVMEFGERKYARDNWLTGGSVHDYHSAMFRHAFKLGTVDAESGLPHEFHALANLMFIITLKHNNGDYANMV